MTAKTTPKAKAKPKAAPRKVVKPAAKRAAKPATEAKAGASGGILWPLVKWSLTIAVWGMIAVVGLLAWYAYDLPDVDAALAETRQPVMTVLAADGTAVARRGQLFGGPATLSDMPRALPQAVIATEDRRFYDHPGLDPIGLARAMATNVMAGGIRQGGSTLTQQLAKNLFLSPDRTLKRKVQEVLLAFWLEARFSKDQILTVYLNRVYFGAGAHGVSAAALKFFDKPLPELSVYESAMMAGLLKAPSKLNPLNDPKAAAERTRVVLSNMVAAGYLTEAQAKAAGKGVTGIRTAAQSRFARHFADWVAETVAEQVGHPDADLVVRTTLDAGIQKALEEAIAQRLGEARLPIPPQAAGVVLDGQGRVLALAGGRDGSAFNRAVEARRQPGSAFKPFVYLAALEAGLRPDSLITDAPFSIDGWSPRNYSRSYEGEMSLAQALAHSSNTAAVRLSETVGRDRVAQAARRAGLVLEGPLPASLALGVLETSPLDLAQAYAPFANGGMAVIAHAVESIETAEGEVLYRRRGSGPGRVIEGHRLGTFNGLMQGAMAEGGTGHQAHLGGRPAGGKTGTTQDSRDAWFAGYTADRVAVVWLGHDDGSPMKDGHGRGLTGGGLPALIWRDVMLAANEGLPVRPLPGEALPDSRPSSSEGGVPTGFWDRLQNLLGGTS